MGAARDPPFAAARVFPKFLLYDLRRERRRGEARGCGITDEMTVYEMP
jgi:hypothetical protein